MDEGFEIPVSFRGEDYSFPASFIMLGYSQKIQVDVFGELINFEPDEERNFRPVLTNEQLERKIKVDVELLKEIIRVIDSVR